MNEVSVQSCEPIGSEVARAPSNRGRSFEPQRANQLPLEGAGLWGFFFFSYWIFQLFFIHKKRERGKVWKKKKTSIHKNLPWHDSPDMLFFFFPPRDKLKELHLVYFTSRLDSPFPFFFFFSFSKWWSKTKKKNNLSLSLQDLCTFTLMSTQLRDTHSNILVVFWKRKPQDLKKKKKFCSTKCFSFKNTVEEGEILRSLASADWSQGLFFVFLCYYFF